MKKILLVIYEDENHQRFKELVTKNKSNMNTEINKLIQKYIDENKGENK